MRSKRKNYPVILFLAFSFSDGWKMNVSLKRQLQCSLIKNKSVAFVDSRSSKSSSRTRWKWKSFKLSETNASFFIYRMIISSQKYGWTLWFHLIKKCSFKFEHKLKELKFSLIKNPKKTLNSFHLSGSGLWVIFH